MPRELFVSASVYVCEVRGKALMVLSQRDRDKDNVAQVWIRRSNFSKRVFLHTLESCRGEPYRVDAWTMLQDKQACVTFSSTSLPRSSFAKHASSVGLPAYEAA